MAESLEDFLNIKSSSKYIDASGSFSCQECDEFINHGKIDEDNMILMYTCSMGHNSRIKL
jgi:hypothetical protein